MQDVRREQVIDARSLHRSIHGARYPLTQVESCDEKPDKFTTNNYPRLRC